MLVEVRNSLQELQWILGFLCAEAREHFDSLNRSERWCGAQGRGVLLQEFLEGTEYIVDHVSCDGVHKTTMLWMYDFQEVNGHRVCIAQRPVPYDSSAMAELVAYTRQCLNALGVRNGATHTEVMWTSGGPCLVEVHTGGSQGKDMRWYEHFEHFAGRTCWSFLIYLDTFCNVSWCWYMLMRKHVKIACFNCAPDVCLFLVQVNCRCQGGTGFWVPLCRKMTGYSQVDAVIGAYLRQESWWFDAASGKIGKENKENGGFHWFQTTSIWNQILIFVEFVEGPERLGLDECFFPTRLDLDRRLSMHCPTRRHFWCLATSFTWSPTKSVSSLIRRCQGLRLSVAYHRLQMLPWMWSWIKWCVKQPILSCKSAKRTVTVL